MPHLLPKTPCTADRGTCGEKEIAVRELIQNLNQEAEAAKNLEIRKCWLGVTLTSPFLIGFLLFLYFLHELDAYIKHLSTWKCVASYFGVVLILVCVLMPMVIIFASNLLDLGRSQKIDWASQIVVDDLILIRIANSLNSTELMALSSRLKSGLPIKASHCLATLNSALAAIETSKRTADFNAYLERPGPSAIQLASISA